MIKRTFQEVAHMLGVSIKEVEYSQIKISGVSINSKTIEAGNLFIPLKGEKRDGHEFVKMAFENGAAASLWQKDYPNPPKGYPLIFVEDTLRALQELAKAYRNELNLKVVGITGSNGKTTTKDITAAILASQYKVQKTIGNFNNEIGLPLSILQLEEDTEIAVLEMGMNRFGEIHLLSNIARPDVAVITNIGDAHLQELGSRYGISKAKLEILNGLKDGGLFVFNGDEPLLLNQIKTLNGEGKWRVKTFGRETSNDLFPTSIQVTTNGMLFTINEYNDTLLLPILGEYNVLNALSAIHVALEFLIPFSKIKKSLHTISLSNMRMELIDGMNGSKILNDAYNASPTSMKAVIDLAGKLEGYKRKILVLGDMLELGESEIQLHEEIGESINPNDFNYLFTFGKLAESIANAARNKWTDKNVFSFQDKSQLIKELKEIVNEGDLIVVKGSRGMKLEEVAYALAHQ